MLTKSNKLSEFLLSYIDGFGYLTSGGELFNMPEYDLYAQDYLVYADKSLDEFRNTVNQIENTRHLIAFVSNIKHAFDSQLNMFLSVYNIKSFFSRKKGNAGLDKQLDFLEKIGLFSSRSLKRFNTMRNRMEHRFEKPQIEIEDMEVYYDLAWAFISVIQSAIVLSQTSEIFIEIYDPENDSLIVGEEDVLGFLEIKYYFNNPKIVVKWKIKDVEEEMACDINEPDEFAFFMKTFFLLHQIESFASTDYIKTKLTIY